LEGLSGLPLGGSLLRELGGHKAGQESVLREVSLVVVEGVRQHQQEHNAWPNGRHGQQSYSDFRSIIIFTDPDQDPALQNK